MVKFCSAVVIAHFILQTFDIKMNDFNRKKCTFAPHRL